MKNRLKFLCFTIAACIIASAMPPDFAHAEENQEGLVKTIVASIIEAYGGRDAVAGVKSVVAKGTIADFMKNAEGSYARYLSRPGKLRIEIAADPAGELRILNGAQGWRGNRNSVIAVKGAPLLGMVYQYTYLDLPMGFLDGSDAVHYEGKREFKGRLFDLLVIEAKGAPKVRVYVDPEKHLIVRAASEFNMGTVAGELSTDYEDFRPVGKVLFPFRLTNYAGDMRLSVITLSDVEINAELPQSLFLPGNK